MTKGTKPWFDLFEQIESTKRILLPVVADKDSFKVRGLVLRCVKYKAGLIKKLNSTEATAYDLLQKNKLRPKTVYEWLLLEDVPPHIKEKLVQHKIGIRTARHQYVQWKRMSGTRAGIEVMEEIRNVIGRLKWKSQEDTPNNML
jgi:hypothetical protein